jgi:hypothetical protein
MSNGQDLTESGSPKHEMTALSLHLTLGGQEFSERTDVK